MSFLQRRLLKGVLIVASHPRATLGVVLAVLAAAIVAATRLTISSDQNKLFSAKVPFFRDYLQFVQRFPENEAVYIVIEPRDPGAPPPVQHWTAAADAVTQRLQSLTRYVKLAVCKIPLDQLGRQGILFQDPAELHAHFNQIEPMIPLARFWGQKADLQTQFMGRSPMERFLAGVIIRRDDQTAGFVAKLADSWNAALANPSLPMRVGAGVVDLRSSAPTSPRELGYFYVPNEQDRRQWRILVRVYPVRNFSSLTSITHTVNAIRDAAVDAAKPFGEFKIGVTGRPALEADEMHATNVDSHHAEIAALLVVFIGLLIMLRSLWLALAAEIALGVGIGWTCGWATLSVGELNLLSVVFLIALIGIGMDYLVQILTRYRLEARRYQRPTAVWVRVFKHVGPPINIACLGAAGAFLVSMLTDFRGAAELGIIAGVGLILCLLAGYTVLPALLVLFPPKLRPLALHRRYGHWRLGGPAKLILPLIWIAALALGSPAMQKTYFSPGLIELQVPNLESVRLVRTLQAWSAIVLSRDPAQLRRVRDAVAPLAVVASTESVLEAQDNADWLKHHADPLRVDWSPPTPIAAGDLPHLSVKAANLADHFDPPPATAPSTAPAATLPPATPAGRAAARSLRDFAGRIDALAPSEAPRAAQRLCAWQEVFAHELKDLLDQFAPVELNIQTVPAEVRRHLLSDDGFYALHIYPRKDLWDQPNLIEFTNGVEKAVATVPGAPPVTGIACDVYHTTGAIRWAFFEATVYALALICILVYLDFGKLRPTLAAISVLGFGLPMLVAIMGLRGMTWNFANFFGLPILIGAGYEYGVFLVHRYLEAKKYPRRVWRRWDASDSALLLCAFITSSSFGFFWLLAHHEGLKSLGCVMTLGTICIYLAGLLVLRPILRWKLDRSHKKEMMYAEC